MCNGRVSTEVEFDVDGVRLSGALTDPVDSLPVVVFAHGSGSGRFSPRNRLVAELLQDAGLGTLLFDLLAPDEEADRRLVFDIPVGQKFAREIFFLGDTYTAEEMHRMGAVNRVVDHDELENVAIEWGTKINGKSPQAQRMLKYAFNLQDDGLVGQQLFAGEATRLAYMTDEAVEGRDSFLQKRDPDWSPYPWYY